MWRHIGSSLQKAKWRPANQFVVRGGGIRQDTVLWAAQPEEGLHAAVFFPAALLLLTLAGCAAQPVKPFEQPEEVEQITQEESRLWAEAERIDEALFDSGQVYPEAKLEKYLQQTINSIYPGFQYTIRVRALQSPMLNAFALPNGSIYFNIGLIARMENEAQLATVLGHEAAHFIQKHSLRQTRQVKTMSAFALGMNIAGIPLIGDVIAISSIYGYSRDLERQADALAYEHLQRAGYDVRESVKVFQHLAAEAEALDEKQPVFFSSHPKLRERIESFNELIASSGQVGGRVERGAYLAQTQGLRLACLEADLSMDRYKSLILVLESDDTARRFAAPHRYYYLGEAYRRRNEEGDVQRAELAYQQGLEQEPDFAATYRGLGILYLKMQQPEKARPLLEKYLALAPDAKDRSYVEHYLEKLNAGGRQS